MYIPASHLSIWSLHLIWPIHPPSTPVGNQGHRAGSSELKESKFLTNFLMGLFFQCFDIHITWKYMPWSESLPHNTGKHLYIIPIRTIFLSFTPLEKIKETSPTIDLCAASPVESLGVLHVRQLKGRSCKKSSLKMPQETFKLHFLVHVMG